MAYGNLSSEQFQKEVSENTLTSSLNPGIYKNAKLVSIVYSNEKVEKATFTFEGSDFKGNVDVLAARTEEEEEKLTRAYAHILAAFGVNIDDVLNKNITSYETLVVECDKAINKERLVDFKVVGYAYNGKYGQNFPISGKSNKGGWIPNSFIYEAGKVNLVFSEYEKGKLAEYDKLKNGKSDESELDKAKEMQDLNDIFKQPEITI